MVAVLEVEVAVLVVVVVVSPKLTSPQLLDRAAVFNEGSADVDVTVIELCMILLTSPLPASSASTSPPPSSSSSSSSLMFKVRLVESCTRWQGSLESADCF